jgi:hypothetical protein
MKEFVTCKDCGERVSREYSMCVGGTLIPHPSIPNRYVNGESRYVCKDCWMKWMEKQFG